MFFLASEKKMTLIYNYTFAYGCLHRLPIPNTTLDTTFTPKEEKDVLMEIFRQTAGKEWRNHAHWGDDSVGHCFWYGITCEHTNNYIISIYLARNNLVGSLPRSLWKLRNLQGLCLGGNRGLVGHPSEIFCLPI